MAVTDTNQRWAPSGQRVGLHQALTSQKGSGSLTSSALKARVAGGGTGRGENVCVGGDRGEEPALEMLPPGTSPVMVAPASQLSTLGRLRGLPHICPLLHGVLQGLGFLLVHLNVVHLLIRSDR